VNRFFDKLEESLKGTSQKYVIDDIFRGQTLTQLKCQNCGFAKTKEGNWFCLQVEVKNKHKIFDSLNAIRDGQIISDYQCDGCNKKVDVQERNFYGDMPNVLIVHEQRIIFDFETFTNKKINTQYDFPNILDLTPYCAKEVLKGENIDQM
jgi:ubiquitin carboxyl-terminal hydrolase 34